MRVPAESAHYGCVRHALSYLLQTHGLSTAAAKHASLLLRVQMLRFAQHDLKFVKSVSAAERTMLQMATRQLCYKAVKLGSAGSQAARSSESGAGDGTGVSAGGDGGSIGTEGGEPVIGALELEEIRADVHKFHEMLLSVPGPQPGASPPQRPLVLSEPELHLLNPSLSLLLGDSAILSAEAAPAAQGAGTGGGPRTAASEAAAAAAALAPTSVLLDEVEVVGLYFSASWCPACQETTPMLAAAYRQLRSRGKRLEVFHASMDRSEEDFAAYHTKMPFPALPFDGQRVAALSEIFGVSGIPSLILLDAEGRLISTDGVRLMRKHARAFPWKQPPPPEMPHVHPNLERLMRPEPVDAGAPFDLPRYMPINFLSQPQAVRSLADAVSVLRECDMLCTVIAVQSHCVLNVNFIKVALIQNTFTALLPLPKPDWAADVASCCWRTPMLYDMQLGILLLLQRLVEHFAASVLSLDQTRSLDGVRTVVPACIAAVADVVMRQLASDKPSRVCVHLRGDGSKKFPGFSVGSAALSQQAATVQVHTAELNTARTCVLDYFAAQETMPKIFPWEKSESLDRATAKWMQFVARDLAFPADPTNTAAYVWDTGALVIKNFPEMRCYRDVVFYFKFFLNPDAGAFPSKRPWTQRTAELTFYYKAPLFFVVAFGETTIAAKPRPKKGMQPPLHRFTCLSHPSEYTKPHAIEGEDDVLHLWELPDFGALDVGSARALGQHDSELLLSYLSVPYLRIPLVVSFFATDDRIHSLQVFKLQTLFECALFEPGWHQPLDAVGVEPVDVPTSVPTLLGTPHHLLLNELSRSPDTLLDGVLKLCRQACDLDTGTFVSSTTTIILFIVRLASRIDNYVSFLLDYTAGAPAAAHHARPTAAHHAGCTYNSPPSHVPSAHAFAFCPQARTTPSVASRSASSSWPLGWRRSWQRRGSRCMKFCGSICGACFCAGTRSSQRASPTRTMGSRPLTTTRWTWTRVVCARCTRTCC